MKPYQRVTSVGYNTGKLIIGCRYQPATRQMTVNECLVRDLIRGNGLPVERQILDLLLKIKSVFRRLV